MKDDKKQWPFMDEDGNLVFERFVDFILEQFNGLHERIKPIEKLGSIEQGIINLGTRLEAVESDIDTLKERITGIDARLTEQLQNRLDSINEGIASLRADTEKGFRSIDRQMDSLSGGITRLTADQRDLEERVDGIERKAS